jgi:hypothetical protein
LLHRFGRTILIAILVVAATSIVTYALTPSKNSESPPHPYTSENTPSPTASFTPNPTYLPTYIPGNKQYPSYGQIYVTGIRIYGGDLQGNSIDWGILFLGSQKNVSFYVQSTSNIPITLALNTTEWMPTELGSYLRLSWNYTGEPIAPIQKISMTLSLTLPLSDELENYLINNSVSSFSFNIHISSMSAG